MSTLGSEPAFPVPDGPIQPNEAWLGHYKPVSDGISTRMYLAAKAMQGMLANGSRVTGLAASAFAVADDMLVEIDRPGRLERLSDDLKDLKAAVALLQPFLTSAHVARKPFIRSFPEKDRFPDLETRGKQESRGFSDNVIEYDKACLRVHEVMARLSSTS